jgi:hypothetical protein
MEIKEFARKVDEDIVNSVIKAAKEKDIPVRNFWTLPIQQPTTGRRIREERRSIVQGILRALHCLSPKRWF